MQHDVIDPAKLRGSDVYRLMTDLVVPRPIAWVSSVGADGSRNLAPYSFFQAVSAAPPTIVLGCGWRRDGTPKDTLRNILETREFTVNHVSRELAEPMVATSGEFEPGFDEWTVADGGAPLESTPAHHVAAPRVKQAKASFECRMTQAIPLGKAVFGNPTTTLIIAEVLYFTVMPGVVEKNDKGRLEPIESARMAAIGRMGGKEYTTTVDTFPMARPK